MSWLRSAVNKAVEVGNKNLTRTVKNYADSVVHHAGQAVADGAKLLQDRLSGRNFRSFKQTVKRLEEASVSCRGPERVELMRRWVAVLKEIKISSGDLLEDREKNTDQCQITEEPKESPRGQSMILYYDGDVGGEPMTFREVFLYSQALEGLSISMILDGPNEDEVSLLLELFGICLTGGKEVHNAVVSSILDLSKAFFSYCDEVLVKREELLQFAEGAISGLKIDADGLRIDAEVSSVRKQLDEFREFHGHETIKDENITPRLEALKEALAHIRLCSRLEGLLLKKKALKCGDTAETHAHKIDKLKVLSESLASSCSKSERRISDYRFQKEEALKFRLSKASEAPGMEKELVAEISSLEKRRDELEAELKKVNISLSAARVRLQNMTEERDQLFEANDQIVAHLKTKEDELARSIGSCRVEADVLSAWINFLEDTWSLQCLHVQIKEEKMNAELERHEDYFTNLVMVLLSSYEKELRPSVDRIGKYVDNLKSLTEGFGLASNMEIDDCQILNPRRNLEEEYLAYEAKIITTFSVVDNMKEQFYSQEGKVAGKENAKVKGLFDNIAKLREEFDLIERPSLEMENLAKQIDSHVTLQTAANSAELEAVKDEPTQSPLKSEQLLDPEAELAKLESEFGKMIPGDFSEEVGAWEFEELEKELRSGDASSSKV